jgi:alkyl hydroperoxide reductase subunit D
MSSRVEALRSRLPDVARDIKLNVQAVLKVESLTVSQRWGVAIASAATVRNQELLEAIIADARLEVEPNVVEDALAAAALMGMNNVYYRFRHLVGKEFSWLRGGTARGALRDERDRRAAATSQAGGNQ